MSGSVISWPVYRLLRWQVRWSDIPVSWRIFQFVVILTVKGFSVVNEAEIDVFLKFSCFFYDQVDVGNLISSSCAFYKSSLNIWKFLFHILLKPLLENLEHYFGSMWDECTCVVVWTFFGIAFLWDWNNLQLKPGFAMTVSLKLIFGIVQKSKAVRQKATHNFRMTW